MIKVGISAAFLYPDPNRTAFPPKQLNILENDLGSFLSRQEVMPILLPDLPFSTLEPILRQMQAFVFQGGADIAPATYGEQPIEGGRWPGDPHRDAYELRIMEWAIHHQKPVLGICRGFQLLNCFFNGTLYQDLAVQARTQILHRDGSLYDQIHHRVRLERDHWLHRLYRSDEIIVNSVHHQGIKDLGRGLIADAHCPDDGLIEAIHHETLTQVMGVQWHPEFSGTLPGIVADPDPLLATFLEKCR